MDQRMKRLLGVLLVIGLIVVFGAIATSGNKRADNIRPPSSDPTSYKSEDSGTWTTKYDGRLWTRNQGYREADQRIGARPDENTGYGRAWAPSKDPKSVINFMQNETAFNEHKNNWLLTCDSVEKTPPDHYSFEDVLGDLQRERRTECEVYHGRRWVKNTKSDAPVKVKTYVTVDHEGVFNVRVQEWRPGTSWLGHPSAEPEAEIESDPVALTEVPVSAPDPDPEPARYARKLNTDVKGSRGYVLEVGRLYLGGPAKNDPKGKQATLSKASKHRVRGAGETDIGPSSIVVDFEESAELLNERKTIRRAMKTLDPWTAVSWYWTGTVAYDREIEVIRYPRRWRLRVFDYLPSDEWEAWKTRQR